MKLICPVAIPNLSVRVHKQWLLLDKDSEGGWVGGIGGRACSWELLAINKYVIQVLYTLIDAVTLTSISSFL